MQRVRQDQEAVRRDDTILHKTYGGLLRAGDDAESERFSLDRSRFTVYHITWSVYKWATEYVVATTNIEISMNFDGSHVR